MYIMLSTGQQRGKPGLLQSSVGSPVLATFDESGMITLFVKDIFLFLFFVFFLFLGPLPVAYGGSQSRGSIGAVAAGLHHSHSNLGSKPRLRPTPQLMATPDP